MWVDVGLSLFAPVSPTTGSAVASCGIASDGDLRDMVERTVANHGRIDVVVFPVGMCQRHDALTISAEESDRVTGVNVRRADYVVRSEVPHMIAEGFSIR